MTPELRGALLLAVPKKTFSLEVYVPFELIGSEKLDGRVNLRVTVAEKAQLKDDADIAGLSVSELIRRRYFGRPIIAKADAVMLKELRRIGGLLKHVHNSSNGAYSSETAATLAMLRDHIKVLSRDRKED